MSDSSDKHEYQNRMPDQEQERLVLRKRAIHLASKQHTDDLKESEMFLHVHLGKNEHYGIPYRHLEEILRPRPITPVPNTPKTIAGTIPYRGELIAVLDLAQLLEVQSQNDNEEYKTSWLVVVTIASGQVKHMTLALRVNEVHGNFHYRPEELSPSLNTTLEIPTGSIHGIFAGKIAILDLITLLSVSRLKLEKKK